MATTARQIHHAPHPCPLMDQSIFEAYCDDFAPHFLSVLSEQTQSKSVEPFTKDNELTIRAELPGVDPDKDIEVTVGDGNLTIKGERREEHKGAERSDFHYGSFIRSIVLPNGTDEKSVHATYKDGILEVKVMLQPVESKMKKVKVDRVK